MFRKLLIYGFIKITLKDLLKFSECFLKKCNNTKIQTLPRRLAFIKKDKTYIEDYKKYPYLVNFVNVYNL